MKDATRLKYQTRTGCQQPRPDQYANNDSDVKQGEGQIFAPSLRLREAHDDEVVGQRMTDQIHQRQLQDSARCIRKIPLRRAHPLVAEFRIVFGACVFVVRVMERAVAADGQAQRPEAQQVCQEIVQDRVARHCVVRAVMAQDRERVLAVAYNEYRAEQSDQTCGHSVTAARAAA